MLGARYLLRRAASTGRANAPDDFTRIGNREVVGHGFNGQAVYADSSSFPFPAIRYKELDPILKALREKEKGDWRSLTLEEKKCLYRASFCQTFAEIDAPTGEWKSIVGFSLIILSASVWFYLFQRKLCDHELPESFQEKNQVAQLKRIIGLRMNPIFGIASKWDYEKDDWK